MTLYLLERTDTPNWEEMRACIVAAPTPKRAKEIAENLFGANRQELKARSIGTANKSIKEGLILEDNVGA